MLSNERSERDSYQGFKSEVKEQTIQKTSKHELNSGARSKDVLVSKRKTNADNDSNVHISQTSDLASEHSQKRKNKRQNLSRERKGETYKDQTELSKLRLKYEDQNCIQKDLLVSSQNTQPYLLEKNPKRSKLSVKYITVDSSSALNDGIAQALILPNLELDKLGNKRKKLDQANFQSKLDHLTEEKVDESTIMNLRPKSKSLQDAEEKYITFLPLIAGTNSKSFAEILVKVLHECLYQLSLDDFYNLLYNYETPDQVVCLPVDGFKVDKSEPSHLRMEGLHLCYLILEKLRLHCVGGQVSVHSPQKLYAKFQDVCKTFLTLKIIFDSIKTVEDNTKSECSLPRISVYKAYYIICQKLRQKYPNKSDTSKTQPNILFTHSQIGKMLKLLFPNLKYRRIGKRGDSIYHYNGVIWNTLLIDDDIKNLIELPLPDIEYNFRRVINQGETSQSNKINSSDGNEIPNSTLLPLLRTPSLQFFTKKAVYSFVHFSTTFLVGECFPRSWESKPGQVPQQSEWAKETMEKSVHVLKTHNIDIEPLISKIAGPVFCAESLDNFLEDILLVIQHLMECSASEELYLHLYLIVSTLIFPIVFSSSNEVSSRDRIQLRASLSNFVIRLEAIPMNASLFCNLMAFVKILKKMIHFNMLILSSFKSSSTSSIIRAMVGDAQLGISRDELMMEDLVLEKAYVACTAFNWEFIKGNLKQSSTVQISIIKNMRDAYTKLSLAIAESLLLLAESLRGAAFINSTYDLLYHLFKCISKLFHEIFLPHNAVMLELPIRLIEYFLLSLTKEFQVLCFRQYAKREHELSKDVFRAWWVHLSTGQEYFNILSEICALNTHLF